MPAGEIHKIIMQSPSKSCLLDPVPTWLVKDLDVLDAVIPTLALAINTSISSGIVPSCLKNGIITPNLKKEGLNPEELKNF